MRDTVARSVTVPLTIAQGPKRYKWCIGEAYAQLSAVARKDPLRGLCALAVVGFLVGAWLQTSASALLTAAAARLYALVRLFDRVRPPAPVRVEDRSASSSSRGADLPADAVGR